MQNVYQLNTGSGRAKNKIEEDVKDKGNILSGEMLNSKRIRSKDKRTIVVKKVGEKKKKRKKTEYTRGYRKESK